MKNFSSLFLRQRAIPIYSIEKLAVFAVLHKNVDFRGGFDNLINLNDVFVKYMSLYIYFLLKSSKLLAIIALKRANLDCNCLACGDMNSLSYKSESTLSYCLTLMNDQHT